jgi:hypothetical protein
MWPQAVDVPIERGRKTGQHAGETRLRLVAVGLDDSQQTDAGDGALAGRFVPDNQSVLVAQCDRLDGVLDQIVAEPIAASVGMADGSWPESQAVIDGLGDVAATQDRGTWPQSIPRRCAQTLARSAKLRRLGGLSPGFTSPIHGCDAQPAR